MDAPKGGCDSQGKPMLEQVCCQDLETCGGPMLELSDPEGLHPIEGIRAGTVCEYLQPVGRTQTGEVHGLSVEGPHAEAREECEEESMAERTRDELTASPISIHIALLAGEEVEKPG